MMDNAHFGGERHTGRPARNWMQAMSRGFLNRCPNCGSGKIFASSFLKTERACQVCGQEFHHHRADDLPAYLVIFIVGHIVVGAFMGVERITTLALWQHLALWVPVTIIACIALLRPVKGAIVGLQWALYMHGFGGEADVLETHPEP